MILQTWKQRAGVALHRVVGVIHNVENTRLEGAAGGGVRFLEECGHFLPNTAPGSRATAIRTPSLMISTEPSVRKKSFPVVVPCSMMVSPGASRRAGSSLIRSRMDAMGDE